MVLPFRSLLQAGQVFTDRLLNAPGENCGISLVIQTKLRRKQLIELLRVYSVGLRKLAGYRRFKSLFIRIIGG